MNGILALFLAVFAAAAPRPPAAANRFYPTDKKLLEAFLDEAFAKAGAAASSGDPVALLVPHAGVEYSGPTAAKAYALLQKGAFDRVVIVGTGHYKALDGAAVYPGDYSIPGFTAAYDAELAAALMKASPLIKADAAAHKKEHSIEVQLPFLKRRLGSFKLVALTMNTQELDAARKIGRALAQAAKGKKVLLIASSDMSHYPKGADADKVDPSSLEALAFLDPAFFWLANRFMLNRGVPDLAVTWCGEGAVTAVMEAARGLGATRAAVLGRVNSGDVVSERDYKHVVGYGAAAFLKGGTGPSSKLSELDRAELAMLARKALAETPAAVPLSSRPKLNLPGAVYVALRAGGKAKGCAGSGQPQETLAEAVVHAAAAATQSLSKEEAAGAAVEVYVVAKDGAVGLPAGCGEPGAAVMADLIR
jgi:MEMO1 family protein